MKRSEPLEIWEINTKRGWLVRPDFVNDAIYEGLIEIINDKWLIHGMNKTAVVKNGDYIVYYKEGIEVYEKETVDAAYEIVNIIKR